MRGVERRDRPPLRTQLRPIAPVFLVWLGGMAVLGLVASRDTGHRAELLLDPTDTGGLPWYVGLVSNLGIVGWCVASIAAFFASLAARTGNRLAAASMLRGGSMLCGLLLLDDLFLLHSNVLPKAIGVPKLLVVTIYGLIAVSWVLANLYELRRTRYPILVLASGALGASIAIDAIFKPSGDFGLLAEDGGKFLGILAMATFFGLTASDVQGSVIREGIRPSAPRRSGDAETHPVGLRAEIFS